MVEYEFPGPSAARIIEDLDSMAGLEHKHASAELASTSVFGNKSKDPSTGLPIPAAPKPSAGQVPLMVDSMGLPLRTVQQQVLANLLRVRGLVQQTRARLEQQRINEFLTACSSGNLDRIRVVSKAHEITTFVFYDKLGANVTTPRAFPNTRLCKSFPSRHCWLPWHHCLLKGGGEKTWLTTEHRG